MVQSNDNENEQGSKNASDLSPEKKELLSTLLEASRARDAEMGITTPPEMEVFAMALISKGIDQIANPSKHAFRSYEREIYGNFPGGYAMCWVIAQDGDWLKFVTPDGRIAWAKPALGTYCEHEKPKSP